MMACGLSKSLGFSSSLKKQQGIVTILGGSNISSAPSLRRTFSADLSSKNWLSHNEVSPMKRISSSEKLHNFGADSLSSQDEEQGSRSGVDIWAQIQEDKTKKKEDETEPSQTDVWSSILSDKKKKKTDTVVEYVHPLVKRASSLSEKSLEICTESLGSETGCEGFSTYASSETGEAEDNLVLDVTVTKEEEEETEVVVVVEVEQEARTVPDQTRCMELPRGSFPPPIRSLSSQTGSALHMKTRRDNGRLVLEAVSMPSHNNFSAKRQDGRLLLTFAEIDKDDDAEEVQWSDKEEEEEEEEEPEEFAYKPFYMLAQKPIEPITVHRLAHKPIGVPRRNTRWPATDESETKSDMSMPIVHSLPPRPRVAQLARSMKPPSTVDDTVGAACFNTCDYSWKPTNNEVLGRNTKTQFQAQNYVQKSMGVVVTHDLVNGCKEPRRSLLSVERFCIATS